MKITFYILMALSLICSLLGFLALADIIQWVVHFPNEFTYTIFSLRFLLGGLGILALFASLYIGHNILHKPKKLLIPYTLVFIGLFVGGFLGPTYLFFRAQQYTAEFKAINEISGEEVKDDEEVFVVEVNGDARAYPFKWIMQPHVAGDMIGGEDVVMTYCSLSNLGLAFKNEYQGKKLDLKVMTQLENNLVMFDANTGKPINQIEGGPVGDDEKYSHIPTLVMSYGSFKKIYSKGRVFYNPLKIYDKPMYSLMEMAVTNPGGQLDINNPKPEFPTIEYKDKRLRSKEQIYGLIVDGRPKAFTKEFIMENGNRVQMISNDQVITLKYFPEFDYVDAFIGPSQGVTPTRDLPNGKKANRHPMYSKILWVIWAHFHPSTQVNQL